MSNLSDQSISEVSEGLRLEDYVSSLNELISSTPEDEHIPLMRELCRNDLYFLLRYGCGREDMEYQFLFDRCREVELSPDGMLDLWSRDHYKSTIITQGLTIQDILKSHGEGGVGREVCIGIFSHTRPIAKGFLRQIKREFEANENLKEWFPDILWDNPLKESPKWSEDDGIIVKRKGNPKECTIEAWGVVDGQPISKHFGILVYDDIVTRDSVNTPDMISKTTEMLELSYNLGSRGGKRRFIGTRYHFNDTWSELIKRGTAKPRIIPATHDGSLSGEPVFLTKQELDEKIRDMGSYTFSCQMLQNPVADSSQGFKREWLKFYDGKVNIEKMNLYMLIDTAGSKNKSSDYTAIWVIGCAPDKNIYVIDIVRDKMNLTERTKMIMELHMKWPIHPKGVRMEKYGLMSDKEHMETVMNQEAYRFEVVDVGGVMVKKEDRIRRLIPYFESGRIWFPRQLYKTGHDGKTTDLISTFIEQEYLAFPASSFDDLLDSLSRLAEPDLPLHWPRKATEGAGAPPRRILQQIKVF